MSEVISKNFKSTILVALLLALGTFTYQSYAERMILFQNIKYMKKDIESFIAFAHEGNRFTKKDGQEIKQYLVRSNANISNLQARMLNIESKKMLGRDEYKQFVEFMKIRFNLLEKKIDDLKK